jgi:hypothetical protein
MVGHNGFFSSLGYQGSRYHLMAIPFLSDDGPFTWVGVPSLLFTDYDVSLVTIAIDRIGILA